MTSPRVTLLQLTERWGQDKSESTSRKISGSCPDVPHPYDIDDKLWPPRLGENWLREGPREKNVGFKMGP